MVRIFVLLFQHKNTFSSALPLTFIGYGPSSFEGEELSQREEVHLARSVLKDLPRCWSMIILFLFDKKIMICDPPQHKQVQIQLKSVQWIETGRGILRPSAA